MPNRKVARQTRTAVAGAGVVDQPGGQGNREVERGKAALRLTADRLVQGSAGAGLDPALYDGGGIEAGGRVAGHMPAYEGVTAIVVSSGWRS